MAKQGFGVATGLFTNTGTGNNSISVVLPASDNEQIITSIHCSYSPVNPAASNYMQFGRLLIVAGRFDNGRSVISPISNLVPRDLPAVIFDQVLSSNTENIDFGARGFTLSPGSLYSIVLGAPATNGDTFPTFADHYGFLNVFGFDVGKSQPFETLR